MQYNLLPQKLHAIRRWEKKKHQAPAVSGHHHQMFNRCAITF